MKPVKTTIIFIGICLVFTAAIVWYLVHSAITNYDEVKSTQKEIRVLIKNGNSLYHEEIDTKALAKGICMDKKYPGKFEVKDTKDGYVVINVVPVEEYLMYVLPSEMPQSFELEALKAQAVCARTFAYSHMEKPKYKEFGADVDDTTDSQVYNKTKYTARCAEAVELTRGEVLCYEGELISCYYFSTSPGKTGDLEVWASSTPDYITVKENDFDKESPFYKWETMLQIKDVYDEERGKLQSIKTLSYSDAGYVTKLEVSYEKDKIYFEKELEIRTFLGKYCGEYTLSDGSKRTMEILPSAYFGIEESNGSLILSGGGYGHGIGLSQYGANGMAKEGYTYKEILGYYFENTTITK